MQIKHKIIKIDGEEYTVVDSYIELLKCYGIIFNKQYIDALRDKSYNLIKDNDLFDMDFYNKFYYGSKGKLKRICKINEYGAVTDYFETLFDAAVLDYDDSEVKYSFEENLVNGTLVDKFKCNFFGKKITVKGHQFGNKSLNSTINLFKKILTKNNQYAIEEYNKNYRKNMPYLEFALIEIQIKELWFGNNLNIVDSFNKKKLVESVEISNILTSLLNRYKIEDKYFFGIVKDLKDLKDSGGVYLMVFKNNILVGKSYYNLEKEIISSIKNRDFLDENHMPSDVCSIYALETLFEGITNKIFNDCICYINSLNHNAILNKYVVDKILLDISSNNFNNAKYILKDKKLFSLLKEINLDI